MEKVKKVESSVSLVEKVMASRKERKAKDKVAGTAETRGTIGPVVGSQEEELQAEVQHILSREEEVEKEEEGIPEAEAAVEEEECIPMSSSGINGVATPMEETHSQSLRENSMA